MADGMSFITSYYTIEGQIKDILRNRHSIINYIGPIKLTKTKRVDLQNTKNKTVLLQRDSSVS